MYGLNRHLLLAFCRPSYTPLSSGLGSIVSGKYKFRVMFAILIAKIALLANTRPLLVPTTPLLVIIESRASPGKGPSSQRTLTFRRCRRCMTKDKNAAVDIPAFGYMPATVITPTCAGHSIQVSFSRRVTP